MFAYYLWSQRIIRPARLYCGTRVTQEANIHFTRDPNTKRFKNERLFILTRTHSMQIFGEIPFIKPQNDTQTTDKRLKTMKNERKSLDLVLER